MLETHSAPDDGYRLWMGYRPSALEEVRASCARLLAGKWPDAPETLIEQNGLQELRDALTAFAAGCRTDAPAMDLVLAKSPDDRPAGSFRLSLDGDRLVADAPDETGILYGLFALIRHFQLGRSLEALPIEEQPFTRLRMLNHWDNLDATFSKTGELVERGYSGGSIFELIDGGTDLGRLRDYARALASVGINHVVLNNVNADARALTRDVLRHVAGVAECLRAWGVSVWLSANFAAPMKLGGIGTANPLDPAVRDWWRDKCDEIYALIPDFGGFLVKADSEGEPGPGQYGCDHHEGANMLAAALRPHGGTCIWRAFVYGKVNGRAGAALEHFNHLDGCFDSNAILQVKHGPVDFQANEPTSPLFGRMPRTRMALELMITQEYTGQAQHLYYYGSLWEHVLRFETTSGGPTIAAACRDGIAGVANVGTDRNWCGHPLAQANWYAFGRMAWNPHLSAREVALEWAELTFGGDPDVVETIAGLLMRSHGVFVDYTGPYGLCMLHDFDHYSPAPELRRYVHGASPDGIGRDRTVASGAGVTAQYLPPHDDIYERLDSCPAELLLYFHRVPLDYKVDGKPILDAILSRLDRGVCGAGDLLTEWNGLASKVPDVIHSDVKCRLERQVQEARRWRSVLANYFINATQPVAPLPMTHDSTTVLTTAHS